DGMEMVRLNDVRAGVVYGRNDHDGATDHRDRATDHSEPHQGVSSLNHLVRLPPNIHQYHFLWFLPPVAVHFHSLLPSSISRSDFPHIFLYGAKALNLDILRLGPGRPTNDRLFAPPPTSNTRERPAAA